MDVRFYQDERAFYESEVWSPRTLAPNSNLPEPGTGGLKVQVDFGNGNVVSSWGHLCHWQGAIRYRLGWPDHLVREPKHRTNTGAPVAPDDRKTPENG